MHSKFKAAGILDDDPEEAGLQNGRFGFVANSCKRENRKEYRTATVTDLSKSYTLLKPGLLLEGTCNTEGCDAHGKRALHSFGFVDELNFASKRQKAVCRLCNKKMKDVDNIGYYQTTIKIEGKYCGEKGLMTYQDTVNDGRYYTFKNGDSQKEMWEFLEITTVKLGQ